MQALCLYKKPNKRLEVASNLPFFRLVYGKRVVLARSTTDGCMETFAPRAVSAGVRKTRRGSFSNVYSANYYIEEVAEEYAHGYHAEALLSRRTQILPGLWIPDEPLVYFDDKINEYRPLAAQFHAYKKLNRRKVTGYLVSLFLRIRRGDIVRTPPSPMMAHSRMFRTQEGVSMVTDHIEFYQFLLNSGSVDQAGYNILESFVYSKKKQGWRRRGERFI